MAENRLLHVSEDTPTSGGTSGHRVISEGEDVQNSLHELATKLAHYAGKDQLDPSNSGSTAQGDEVEQWEGERGGYRGFDRQESHDQNDQVDWPNETGSHLSGVSGIQDGRPKPTTDLTSGFQELFSRITALQSRIGGPEEEGSLHSRTTHSSGFSSVQGHSQGRNYHHVNSPQYGQFGGNVSAPGFGPPGYPGFNQSFPGPPPPPGGWVPSYQGFSGYGNFGGHNNMPSFPGPWYPPTGSETSSVSGRSSSRRHRSTKHSRPSSSLQTGMSSYEENTGGMLPPRSSLSRVPKRKIDRVAPQQTSIHPKKPKPSASLGSAPKVAPPMPMVTDPIASNPVTLTEESLSQGGLVPPLTSEALTQQVLAGSLHEVVGGDDLASKYSDVSSDEYEEDEEVTDTDNSQVEDQSIASEEESISGLPLLEKFLPGLVLAREENVSLPRPTIMSEKAPRPISAGIKVHPLIDISWQRVNEQIKDVKPFVTPLVGGSKGTVNIQNHFSTDWPTTLPYLKHKVLTGRKRSVVSKALRTPKFEPVDVSGEFFSAKNLEGFCLSLGHVKNLEHMIRSSLTVTNHLIYVSQALVKAVHPDREIPTPQEEVLTLTARLAEDLHTTVELNVRMLANLSLARRDFALQKEVNQKTKVSSGCTFEDKVISKLRLSPVSTELFDKDSLTKAVELSLSLKKINKSITVATVVPPSSPKTGKAPQNNNSGGGGQKKSRPQAKVTTSDQPKQNQQQKPANSGNSSQRAAKPQRKRGRGGKNTSSTRPSNSKQSV